MNAKESLGTNHIILVASAKILAAGLGFLSIIMVARLLPTTEFGIFSLAMAVMIIALELSGTGIDLSMVRFYSLYRGQKKSADLVLKVALKLKMINATIVFICGLLLAKPLAIYFFKKPDVIVSLRIIFVVAFIASIWGYMLAVFQANKYFRRYAFLDFINGVLKISFIGLFFLIFHKTLFGVLITYVMIFLTSVLIGWVVIPKKFLSVSGDEREVFYELVRFSKWIIISGIVFVVYSRLDLLMLGYFKEAPLVAKYAAALNLITAVDILILGMVTVLLPKVCELTTKTEYVNYIQRSLKLTVLTSLILLPTVLLAKPAIFILYGAKFSGSVPIFSILFIGSLISLSIAPIILVFFGVNLPQYVLYSEISSLSFSFIGNLFIIPKYGAIGAAWITMSSKIVIGLVVFLFVYFKIFRSFHFGIDGPRPEIGGSQLGLNQTP